MFGDSDTEDDCSFKLEKSGLSIQCNQKFREWFRNKETFTASNGWKIREVKDLIWRSSSAIIDPDKRLITVDTKKPSWYIRWKDNVQNSWVEESIEDALEEFIFEGTRDILYDPPDDGSQYLHEKIKKLEEDQKKIMLFLAKEFKNFH